MDLQNVPFWAKTTPDGQPGISVFDHSMNVGCVAHALIQMLPQRLKLLLPSGAAALAALHDVGKITIGFQSAFNSFGMLELTTVTRACDNPR